MKSQIIDGKVISAQVRSEISVDVSKLKNDHNIIPKLAVILIGDDAASQVYVRNKQKSALSIGMHAEDYKFSTSDTTESVINLINDLNNDPYINGIIVQLPLHETVNKEKI